jgi:adenine/guanine phosphoribosyltransferase-like PRPP-binding protein
MLVKVGADTVRVDAIQNPVSPEQVKTYLVHPDGFLRVPVLMIDDLLVRGYTAAMYREALESRRGVTP